MNVSDRSDLSLSSKKGSTRTRREGAVTKQNTRIPEEGSLYQSYLPLMHYADSVFAVTRYS